MTRICPRCGSDRTRRGGAAIWGVYVALIAIALPAVLLFHMHAGLVATIMIAVIVLAHLTINQWVCLDCGHQWRASG